MPPYNRLKPNQRSEIIALRNERIPFTQISNRLNIPYKTVRYTWKQRTRRDENQRDLYRSGRPRSGSELEVHRLYEKALFRPNCTWAELLETTSLSQSTVRRRMREIDPDFKKFPKRWCPYLTSRNIAERMEYASTYALCDADWWSNAWFTDECSIQIGADQQREWVWRHTGEQWEPRFRKPRPLHHDTVMIWCGIHANRTLKWCFVDEYMENERTVTGAVYARLLRDILPQIYEGGQIWIQDNAPVHTASVAKQVLEELGVWSLPHPAKSLDHNVIEHLWFTVKSRVFLLHLELLDMPGGPETRKEAFKSAIREAFAEILSQEDWDLPTKLVHSMPRRIQAVLAVNGQQTKY
jgi:transposase